MANENRPASAGSAELCLPPKLRKPRLRGDEASLYLELAHGLRVAKATLAKWRSTGGGPRFEKAGATPLYRLEFLDEWATAKISAPRRSTSDTGAAA
jgi:hypothetical protein